MREKYVILVSGASGIVGYGILKSLKNSGCRLIGTTIYQDSPALCFSDIVEIIPKTTDENYLDSLLELISKYSVNMIIPGIEADMSFWNKNRSIIEKTGTQVLLNSERLIELCLDKWMFYKQLVKNNVSFRIESALDLNDMNIHFPCILKPRCGFGARGIVKISNEKELEPYMNQIGDMLMVQEYVGSNEDEYTVSAFFDMKSERKAIIALKRKLSPAGYTEMAEIVDSNQFVKMIDRLSQIFKPVGPTNFQFRKQGAEWKLLEINPRISSSTSIKTAFGYNECEMAVDYFLNNNEVSQPEIRYGKAIRYIEDYIIYK